MEWEVTPEELTLEMTPPCPFDGKHTYRIAIEEGKVALTPVEHCVGWPCWRPELDEIEMFGLPLRFRLQTNRECWENYKPTHGNSCDHNFWVELVLVALA